MPTRELAAGLNRALRAVYLRAHELGLVHGYIRAFSAAEDRAIGLAPAHGLSIGDLAEALGRCEDAGAAVDHRAAMTADVGGDRRCAACCRLRQRQSPSLGERGAEDDPRMAILVDQLRPRHVAGEVDPGVGVVGGDAAERVQLMSDDELVESALLTLAPFAV